MSSVNLAIIDDRADAHASIDQWAKGADQWFTLHQFKGLISHDKSVPALIAQYKVARQELLALEGPTIVILDCCLIPNMSVDDPFLAELIEELDSLAPNTGLSSKGNQVAGFVLGLRAAASRISPLMVVVATTEGASTIFRKTLESVRGDGSLLALSSEAVGNADALSNVDNMAQYMAALKQKWDEWQNSPPYTGSDESIRGLLALYDDCWRNNWDGSSNTQALDVLKQFAHGQFSQGNTEHSKNAMKWLFRDGNRPVFCGNSLKGLLVVDHNCGSPSRYKVVTKPVKHNYLAAAIDRLEIQTTLQPDVTEWFLPVTPGVAFLISLKTFLNSLVEDNTSAKYRPRPRSVEWKKTVTESTVIFSIEVELDGLDKAGAKRLLNDESNAARSLESLTRAHTDGVSTIKSWCPLFRVGSKGHTVADKSYENGKICIKWCVET